MRSKNRRLHHDKMLLSAVSHHREKKGLNPPHRVSALAQWNDTFFFFISSHFSCSRFSASLSLKKGLNSSTQRWSTKKTARHAFVVCWRKYTLVVIPFTRDFVCHPLGRQAAAAHRHVNVSPTQRTRVWVSILKTFKFLISFWHFSSLAGCCCCCFFFHLNYISSRVHVDFVARAKRHRHVEH